MAIQTEFQIKFTASCYLFNHQIEKIKETMEGCEVQFSIKEETNLIQIGIFSSENKLTDSDIFNLGCIVQKIVYP